MVVRRSAPLGSIFFNIRVSGSMPPVDRATTTCALGEGSATSINQTIIPNLPSSTLAQTITQKNERAKPRYSRTLGQSSCRMLSRTATPTRRLARQCERARFDYRGAAVPLQSNPNSIALIQKAPRYSNIIPLIAIMFISESYLPGFGVPTQVGNKLPRISANPRRPGPRRPGPRRPGPRRPGPCPRQPRHRRHCSSDTNLCTTRPRSL